MAYETDVLSHKNRQRLASFISAILLIVPLLHGNDRAIASSPAVAVKWRVANNHKSLMASRFVIGAFPGPPDGHISEMRFREIREAGIDVIVPFWGTMDGRQDNDMLDLAHAADLKVLAMDKRIGPPTRSASAEFDPSVVESIVADYSGHPALFAYGVRDEPSAELFGRVAEICRVFRSLDPKHPPLVNLFPGYATTQQLGAETYREYVLKFVRQVNPAVLMYDHYPFKANRAIDTGWHRDLALFREISQENRIAFWIFVQCQGIRGSLRVPTRTEIFHQAATALAYGAKGIWWYRYWTQPPDEPDAPDAEAPPLQRHLGSMIDREGNRSPSYDYVRRANRFLAKAGPALIGWENTHTARLLDAKPATGDLYPGVSLSGENLDLVVGAFTRGPSIRLVLANDNYRRSAVFRIAADDLRIARIVASAEAQLPPDLNAAADSWQLGPAGCVVIELSPAGKISAVNNIP